MNVQRAGEREWVADELPQSMANIKLMLTLVLYLYKTSSSAVSIVFVILLWTAVSFLVTQQKKSTMTNPWPIVFCNCLNTFQTVVVSMLLAILWQSHDVLGWMSNNQR